MRLRSFRSLRPPADKAAAVCSPPYDVISSEEARALAAGNPDSFLHVIKPEIDLPSDTDPYADEIYATARANFLDFQARGLLERDSEARLFVYRQQADTHVQDGIVGLCHIDDYAQDRIKKHERTLQKKEDDRTRHVHTLQANAGPVFLTYRDDTTLNDSVQRATTSAPLMQLTAEDGVIHTAWTLPAETAAAFAAVPCAYIADGHHRTASAARVGTDMRAANPNHTGNEDYNWFLSVLFPASQLQVLAYNRLVKDLNGHTPASLLAAVEDLFDLSSGSPEPRHKGEICMFLNGAWHALQVRDVPNDPVASLDVSLLQDRLLCPLLGIDDPRTSPRISFKGGHDCAAQLQAAVESGDQAVAFSLFPTSVLDMMDVADAGLIMPPKSTWFEPKLRSGLFVHTLS